MNHSQDYHDHMFDPGPLEPKQYSLDELMEFCQSELISLWKLRAWFPEEPKDSLVMDTAINKFKQIKEELFRLKDLSEWK